MWVPRAVASAAQDRAGDVAGLGDADGAPVGDGANQRQERGAGAADLQGDGEEGAVWRGRRRELGLERFQRRCGGWLRGKRPPIRQHGSPWPARSDAW